MVKGIKVNAELYSKIKHFLFQCPCYTIILRECILNFLGKMHVVRSTYYFCTILNFHYNKKRKKKKPQVEALVSKKRG